MRLFIVDVAPSTVVIRVLFCHVFDGIRFTAWCPLDLPLVTTVLVLRRKTRMISLGIRMRRVVLAAKLLGFRLTPRTFAEVLRQGGLVLSHCIVVLIWG